MVDMLPRPISLITKGVCQADNFNTPVGLTVPSQVRATYQLQHEPLLGECEARVD